MSSTIVASATLGSICLGILIGVLLRIYLPTSHLHDDSKDIVKTAAGLMATLVALIIGLLVGSAKQEFDATGTGLTTVGAKIIALDRVLARYDRDGPDTMKSERVKLHKAVDRAVQEVWGEPQPNVIPGVDLEMVIEQIHDRMRDENPKGEAQKVLQGQAISLCTDISHALWQLIEQAQNEPPMAFLIVLIFWLAVLFMSFGLLAPRNGTAICAMLICAVSISCAIFLILEMNRPFEGAIQVSSAPLTKAVSLIDR